MPNKMELCFSLRTHILEYGTSVSYVVSMEGTQCPNFWVHWETYWSVDDSL